MPCAPLIRCVALAVLLGAGTSLGAQEPTPRKEYDGHLGAYCVAIHPQGKLMASGGSENKVILWDLSQTKPLVTLRGHADSVQGVAFSPDGQWLASCSSEGTVRLWSVADRKEVHVFKDNDRLARSVVFSPDSKSLAAGLSKECRVWDVATRRLKHHREKLDDEVGELAYSPDGKVIALATDDWDFDRMEKLSGDLRLWEPATGKERVLVAHKVGVWGVSFSADGKTVASASDDKTVKLWDVASLKLLHTLEHGDRLASVAFAPAGGGDLVASTDHAGVVILWDARTGKKRWSVRAHSNTARQLAWHPDGKSFVTAGHDGMLKLWDAPGKE